MDKPKKFITFPYPYMNGRLHLGHAYTILSADMLARYYESKGYNVLFPFSFHGSGMPIVACAAKICRETENINYKDNVEKGTQIRILLDMGVTIDEIENFKDPKYWIKYFSQKAKEDLIRFGISADFSRSFYTTDLNPIYDSFIKWQFTHLINDGYITKGKRHIIYSPLDGQPCADHDRSVGEGIDPICIEGKLINTKYGCMIATFISKDSDEYMVNKKDIFVTFDIKNKKYICNENAYKNILYQYENVGKPVTFDITLVCDQFCNISFGSGIYVGNKQNIPKELKPIQTEIELSLFYENFSYYEPAKLVMSRSGDKCIVAYSDQWYINYGEKHLKAAVNEYIEHNFTTPNPSVYNNIVASSEWLQEWPLSRNYGLGTMIPNTDKLIDSLSDSTIYTALYTVYHIIQKIPLEYITYDMWNYIFLDADMPNISNDIQNMISDARKEFKYWYPVDIRVSGKDLVSNHLTMSLYNHYAIWKDKSYLPKSYIVNGYLLLNGEKMSKQTGNFLTLYEALDKYGADVTRYLLSENDGINDGNFNAIGAKSASVKLDSEFEFIKDFYTKENIESNNYFEWDTSFDAFMIDSLIKADEGYKNSRYSHVFRALNAIISAKNNYIYMTDLCNVLPKTYLIKKYIRYLWLIARPITPFWAEKVKDIIITFIDGTEWMKWQNDIILNENHYKHMYLHDILFNLLNECNSKFEKIKRKKIDIMNCVCEIYIYKGFTELENKIISNTLNSDSQDKKIMGQIMAFRKVIEKRNELYTPNWIKWTDNENKLEYEIIAKYFPLVCKKYNHKIFYVNPSDESQFNYGASFPRTILVNNQ